MAELEQTELSVVAEFPVDYFLENLAVRCDGSILVTAMNKKELWLVPAPAGDAPVAPTLLHTFELMTMFLAEIEPDVFVLGTADVYDTHRAVLYRLDLNGPASGRPLAPEPLLELPEPHIGLNGGCLIAPRTLLAAGVADLIWRIDLPADGPASARIWMRHDSMKNRPGEKKPEQPGVNGLAFDRRTNALYYTSTSQQLMMRVAIDPATLDPAELPVFIAGGRYWDDLLIDQGAGVAYVTTHRENTIDRIVLQPDGNREGRSPVAGDPFDDRLVGPSAGAWGRAPGDAGRIAYVTTDGGTAQSPDGRHRTAKLLRVKLVTAGG